MSLNINFNFAKKLFPINLIRQILPKPSALEY